MTPKVIADLSGSVAELGKKRLLANLLRTIRFLSASAEIYSWQEEITPINDINAINPSGKNSLSSLASFMEKSGGSFLLISDSSFDSSVPINSSLTTVALGADADIHALSRLSGKNRCFMAENIRAAFDSASHDD